MEQYNNFIDLKENIFYNQIKPSWAKSKGGGQHQKIFDLASSRLCTSSVMRQGRSGAVTAKVIDTP